MHNVSFSYGIPTNAFAPKMVFSYNYIYIVFIILDTTGHASSKEKLLLTLAGLDYKL